MRWLNLGLGVAVVTLLAFNLGAQLATQRKLDALAPMPAVAPPPAETAKVAAGVRDDGYVIEAPDILTIDLTGAKFAAVAGQHIVRPDGTVSLGVYGNVEVSGQTVAAARQKIEAHLSKFADHPTATVRVHAANSKCYYVISQGADGEQVQRVPCFGNETVLDAVGAADAKGRAVHVARRKPTAGAPWQVLPVDLAAIQCGRAATNYQLMPGDRVYVATK